MPWEDNSARRAQLPSNWNSLRQQVKARAGGRCEEHMRNGSRCHDKGTDCHHVGDNLDHSLTNLMWICAWHHQRITAKQAAAARPALTERYPAHKHPGLR